jgi:hypothetical protein
MDADTASTAMAGTDLEAFLGTEPGPLVDLSREDDVTLGEFFTDSFVAETTEFDSLGAFLAATPWDAATFADVPRDELDGFVAEHAAFDSWAGMVAAAGDEFAHRSSY